MIPADKLLPCPFCGSLNISEGEVFGEHAGKTFSQSACLDCGALGPEGKTNGPDFGAVAANTAWNARAAIRAELGEAVPTHWAVGNEVFTSLSEAIEEIQQWGPSGSIAVPLYTTPPASVPVEALGLLDALRWYVEHDDTNEGQPGNEYYIAGRDRARAAIEAFVAAQEKP